MKIKWFPHKNDFPFDRLQLTDIFYAERKVPFFVSIILLVFAGISVYELSIRTDPILQFASSSGAIFFLLGASYYFFKFIYLKDAVGVAFTDHDLYAYIDGYGYVRCPWDAIESTELVTVTWQRYGPSNREIDYRYLLLLIKPEYAREVLPEKYVRDAIAKPRRGLGRDQERKIVISELATMNLDELKSKIDARIHYQ